MSKTTQIAEHIVITFFEAGVAYLIVIPKVSWNKAVLVGAIGAGLSAVYNYVRQSNPTIQQSTPPVDQSPVVVPPSPPAV